MNPPPAKPAGPEAGTWTDLPPGASQWGIRQPVLIESQILEDYSELRPPLGFNVAGVILSVLWARQAVDPALPEDGCLMVCPAQVRRENGWPAEVQLRAEPHG